MNKSTSAVPTLRHPMAAERCPSCFEDECLEPILIDGDVYHVCCACDYSIGIDDSMNQDMLAAMIVADCLDLDEDGKSRGRADDVASRDQLVKVKIAVCHACGNDEICLMRIVGCDENTGNISLECMVCENKMSAPIGNDPGTETRVDTDRHDCKQLQFTAVPEMEVTPVVHCDRCGNDNGDLFSIDVDPTTGALQKVRCFVCDREYNSNESSLHRHHTTESVDDVIAPASRGFRRVESSSGTSEKFVDDNRVAAATTSIDKHVDGHIRRRHFSTKQPYRRWLGFDRALCTNDDDDADDDEIFGSQFTSKDAGPLRQQSTSTDAAIGRRERVRSLSRLGPGDHIAWHKWYAVWHHAIVIEVDCRHSMLTVIHNSGGTMKSPDGKFASVRLETIGVDLVREDLYRHVYVVDDQRSCFQPEAVIHRATSLLGQTYNPFTFNCEHFARWCKTGHQVSAQVETFLDRLSNAGRTAAAGYGKEALASVSKSFNSSSNVIGRGPASAAIVFTLTVESATFAREAKDAYRKYCDGQISRADFRQQLAQTGCECVGGLVTSAVFGAIGQVVIPVPAVGGFVGSSLGNLIGHWCGSMIGRQIKT